MIIMGKKNKNKPKKVSAKKEKYKKFRKEKPGTMDISMPEPTDEEIKQRRVDEETVNRFMRFNPRNPRPKEIVERRAKSKR